MPNTVTKSTAIELVSSWVSLRADGIMQIILKPNITVTKEDAQKMVEAMANIGKGKIHPVVIIADEYTLPEADARPYIASKAANKYTIANAFVINSIAQKLMANIYLKVDKPNKPTKFFSNEEDAIKWLKTFLQH